MLPRIPTATVKPKRMPVMRIGPLFGPADFQSQHLRVRVFYPGGETALETDLLSVGGDDGALRLYRIAEQDDKGTRLEVSTAFQREGWLGFTVEGKGIAQEPERFGFRPLEPGG